MDEDGITCSKRIARDEVAGTADPQQRDPSYVTPGNKEIITSPLDMTRLEADAA